MKLAKIPAGVLSEVRQSGAANDNRLSGRSEFEEIFPEPPDATPAVLDAVREQLRRHGPAVDGQSGGLHAVHAAAILTHDFALSDDDAWPLMLEWNATCVPPWGEDELDDLRTKLENGRKYGKLPVGCRRLPLESMPLALKAIDDWEAAGSDADTMDELLRRVRSLTRNVGTLANRERIQARLKQATGLSFKALDLPKDVDPVARAEREAREQAFQAGDAGVIDPKDPHDTAKRFLSTTQADGIPGLIRTDDAAWLERHDDENRWTVRSDEGVNRAMIAYLTSGKTDRSSGQPLKPERTQVEGSAFMLKEVAFRQLGELPALLDRRDGDPEPRNVIAFRNGLLDVATRAFTPPTRRFVALNALPYAYDTAAPEPAGWLKFLNEVWPNDAESISTLQEIMGLLTTPDTSFQKIFGLFGAKRGGKGTIGRVIAAMIGPENICSPALGSFGQTFGLEGWIGKLAAIVSDARLNHKTDINALVETALRISGQDAVDVNRKFLTARTLRLNARIVLISNEPPALADASGALASRFIILRFRESFLGREDHQLEGRLLAELPGIFNWALDGLERLRARGRFIQPASGREAVEELERLGSPVRAFVQERCEVGPGARVAISVLFEAWRLWCSTEGREHAGTSSVFSKNIKAAFPGVTVTQPRINGVQVRHFEGIALRPMDLG